MDLEQIDAEQHGPMGVLVDGARVELPGAVQLSWKTVAAASADPYLFRHTIWPAGVPLLHWQVALVQRAWIQHNGLLETGQLRRLVYMLEKYYNGIEFDLRYKGLGDLGQMWRDRRWRELLNLIDQLPSDSQLNRLLTQDEDYMRQVLGQKGQGDSGPSMAEWSQTNRMMADLIDAVNRLTLTTRLVAGAKGGNDFHPYSRPKTAADRIRHQMERAEHEAMNAILLRDRA